MCAVPHRSDGKRPPFTTKLSGRRTGQVALVPSSRPSTSAWHEHAVCLPEAAEAGRGSAPRGWGYVRTSVCERGRRAGVGGREATVPQNHSSAGQGMFCGQVFNFPFLYWPGLNLSCDVGSTKVAFHHHRGWAWGVAPQHCRASSAERGESCVKVTFPFQHRSKKRGAKKRGTVFSTSHALGQLDLHKAYTACPHPEVRMLSEG